uniref:Uncharacterized protein n=1 Tax=Pinguiococcus pyrenoidosus TaxID=172671 RepID=A0A7R9Y9S4_9STRA|mmetsp:Transcript_12735/g.47031  ORF Transcript_12735/g.47031 Transcript_12735/m.47031 type:complete len:403 (+) Transcript_12735:423-1631(+)
MDSCGNIPSEVVVRGGLIVSPHVSRVSILRRQGLLPWTAEMRGRWFKEEFDYFNKMYTLFQDGLLADVEAGQAFREFMGDILACDTMRISKKFCGDARIGHLRFPRTPKRDLTEEDLMRLMEEMHIVEKSFLQARARIRPRKRQRSQSIEPGTPSESPPMSTTVTSPPQVGHAAMMPSPSLVRSMPSTPRSLSMGSMSMTKGWASTPTKPTTDQDASGLLLEFLDSVHRTADNSPSSSSADAKMTPERSAHLAPADGWAIRGTKAEDGDQEEPHESKSAMKAEDASESGSTSRENGSEEDGTSRTTADSSDEEKTLSPFAEAKGEQPLPQRTTDLPWAARIHSLFQENPGDSYWSFLSELGEEVERSLTTTLGDAVERVRDVFEEEMKRVQSRRQGPGSGQS